MRSLLFVPGSSERKLAKALSSGADAVIIDLEDSVAAGSKSSARELTRSIVDDTSKGTARPGLYVRINGLSTALWESDLTAIVPAAPDGIMLPKPRSGEDVIRLSLALHQIEREAGIAQGKTRILTLPTEVPASLLVMASYVGASTRLEGLAWGAEDLSAALGARATRDGEGALTSPFRLARDLCLITAAAAGCSAIDGVWLDLRDAKGLEREASGAARDGFSGKLAIHPDQVAVINAAFTPGADEIARAEVIIRAFAESPDLGVIAHDGQMLDRPHLARAERLLVRARFRGPGQN